MKHIILMLMSLLVLVGCHDQTQPQEQTGNQVEFERQERVAAEKHADESERNRNLWQSVAFIFGMGAFVLLIGGIIMGSAAKKHAKRD